MNAEFSLAAYAALLRSLSEMGYRDVPFQDADTASAHLILRHDVDMTLESAVKVAEVEAALGMHADYFILLRSDIYNPLSERGARGVIRILELGHRIGLHFDASLYADQDEDKLNQYCTAECAQLESWFGIEVRMVSFHRPAPAFLGLKRKIGGREHTYQPRYFKDIAYCSDSRGGWHHGHPLDRIRAEGRRAIQLLTHPVWWDSEGLETPAARLDRLAADSYDRYRNDLARNCQPYAEALRTKFINS